MSMAATPSSSAAPIQNLSEGSMPAIAETGANQRAKAELALKKAQLAVEEKGLALEKYKSDQQMQSFANLNASNERQSDARNATEMQTKGMEINQRQAEASQEQQRFDQTLEIKRKLDQKAEEQDRIDEDEATERFRSSLQGAETDLEQAKKSGVKAQSLRVGIAAAEAVSNAELPLLAKNFDEMMENVGMLHKEMQRGMDLGRAAVYRGALSLGRIATKDAAFDKRGKAGIGKSWREWNREWNPGSGSSAAAVDAQGRHLAEIEGEASPEARAAKAQELRDKGYFAAEGDAAVFKDGGEMSRDILHGMLPGIVEGLDLTPEVATQVTTVAQEYFSRWSEFITNDELKGHVGKIDEAEKVKLKEVMDQMNAIPGLNRAVFPSLLQTIEEKFKDVRDAGERGDFALIKDPDLKETLSRFQGDKGSRAVMLKASRLLSVLSKSSEAAVGAHNLYTPEQIKEFTKVWTNAVSTRLPLAQIKATLEKNGLDDVERRVLDELDRTQYETHRAALEKATKDKGDLAAQEGELGYADTLAQKGTAVETARRNLAAHQESTRKKRENSRKYE